MSAGPILYVAAAVAASAPAASAAATAAAAAAVEIAAASAAAVAATLLFVLVQRYAYATAVCSRPLVPSIRSRGFPPENDSANHTYVTTPTWFRAA